MDYLQPARRPALTRVALRTLLLIPLLLSGCASSPTLSVARIAPDLRFTMPPLAPDSSAMEAVQVVSGEVGTTRVQFQSHIKIQGGEVTVVMLDPAGRRGLEIRWNAQGITAQAAVWLPDTVRAANVLADIVMAHWPAAAIELGLAGSGAHLQHDAARRIVRYAGREVLRIDYDPGFIAPWRGSLVIRNTALGYTLKIRSMPHDP